MVLNFCVVHPWWTLALKQAVADYLIIIGLCSFPLSFSPCSTTFTYPFAPLTIALTEKFCIGIRSTGSGIGTGTGERRHYAVAWVVRKPR